MAAESRKVEEHFYRNTKPPQLSPEVIRQVTVQIDTDGDLVFAFANAQRKYALVICLQDSTQMGWKECQAVNHAMQIAARGTKINNETFVSVFDKLKEKYGKTQGPVVQSGHLVGVVTPGRGTINTDKEHTILHTGIKFDRDGDLVFKATTSSGCTYRVCIELKPIPRTFLDLDCKAFCDVLNILEAGDIVDPDSFLAFFAAVRSKYNFITPTINSNRSKLAMSIFAADVPNSEPLHPDMKAALERVRKKVHAQEQSSPTSLSCPYPGITYTKAIKEGGQGQVYAARRGAEKVAVKVFASEGGDERESYKTELRMLLKMSKHPNVVQVLDFFENPSPALVMRLIEGSDLSDYIQQHGRFSQQDGFKLIVGIAEGLCHLHRSGVIHRDLKTANIVRCHDGTPVIIDLGLGGVLERKSKKNHNVSIADLATTLAGTHMSDKTESIKGTVPWMAPEMISGQIWSEKTDVYAFGIILWEIFSGQSPLPEGAESIATTGEPGLMAILMLIHSGKRPPMNLVSHIDGKLRNLIQACWHQEPSERPSMRRVLDLLNSNDPRAIFSSVDKDGNGSLDFLEFAQFLQRYAANQVEPGQMVALFEAIDENGSGSIELGEFEEFWKQVDVAGLSPMISKTRKSLSKVTDSNVSMDFQKHRF